MADNHEMSCVFMGLPNSGKSTYIAALWHVLDTEEVESFYTIDTPPENREYLNLLRDSWLNFKAPARTNIELLKPIEFSITEKGEGATFKFVFPDLSGEMYESQFEHRVLSSEYVEMIKKAEGIVLFVNPNFIQQSNLITEVDDILKDKFFEDLLKKYDLKRGSSVTQDEIPDSNKRKSNEVAWQYKYCQTQVILIDLLQMVMNIRKKLCKIVVVVSAWDMVLDSADSKFAKTLPIEWFAKFLPLLKQFFIANGDDFSYDVFGVSAQGGSYTENVEKLQEMPNAGERIKVQYGSELNHDITLPFKWLLNG